MRLSLAVALAAFALSGAEAARAPLNNVADVARAFQASPLGPTKALPITEKAPKHPGFAAPKKTLKIDHASLYIPNTYMVEYEAASQIADPFAHTKASLRAVNPKVYTDKSVQARTHIDTPLFKGTSFTIDSDHNGADLLKIPGVKNIYPVRKIARPAPFKVTRAAQPDPAGDITSHVQTGVAAQHAAGFFGQGIKIAVVDTGVYWKHPALGGCFGEGCKISFGEDLAGDNYDPNSNAVPVPNATPLENCTDDSHGTHTTGIIGASAIGMNQPGFIPYLPFQGVAPKATLGHYRVFGCVSESTGSDLMAKAIYHAFEADADIISMSLGEAGVIPVADIDAVAIERVSVAGVHVVVSAGNDGGEGLWTIGAPSNVKSAYSVASWDNHAIEQASIFGPDGASYPYSPAAANGGWKGDQHYQIAVADPTDGCLTKNYPAAAGKVILATFTGQCGTSVICGNAAKLNATGCLLRGVGGAAAGNAAIPGATINPDVTTALVAALAKTPAGVFRFTDQMKLVTQSSASTASDFTSYGSDVELNGKPDIASIGGNVYSTVSPHAAAESGSVESYAYLSGTSMACPNFAGSLALFLERRGRMSPAKAKAYFQNSAQLTKLLGTDLLENPIRAGAGLVNTTAAILSQSIITPSMLELNDTVRMKPSYKFNLKNGGRKSVTYTLTDVSSALATGMTKGDDIPVPLITYTQAAAKVSLSQKKVTIAAGKSIDITAKFTQPKAADASLFPFFGGYIVATPNDGSNALTLPYLGLVGDFSKAKIIAQVDSTPNSVVTALNDQTGTPITEGQTLNATEGIISNVVLGQSTRLVFTDVIAAGHNTLPGYTPSLGVIVSPTGAAAYSPNTPRNIDTKGQGYVQGGYQTQWNGNVTLAPSSDQQAAFGQVLPPGTYKVRWTALKHFSDLDKPESYEVVTSPSFKLVY
ncbi:hypothetical protein HKX48_007170 [Thoreauomyces humboldtii]|nr:hypothetical protein HKX48_007170 [Thoreauomyces humboldtii]